MYSYIESIYYIAYALYLIYNNFTCIKSGSYTGVHKIQKQVNIHSVVTNIFYLKKVKHCYLISDSTDTVSISL